MTAYLVWFFFLTDLFHVNYPGHISREKKNCTFRITEILTGRLKTKNIVLSLDSIRA